MTTNKKNKKLSILFGLGIIGLAYGLAYFYIDQQVNFLAAGIAVLGAAVLVFCFMNLAKTSLKALQWKKNGMVVLFVFVLGGFSVGINYLACSLPWRWDVTKARQHTLADSTTDFIKNLDRDIQVTALYVGIPPKYIEDMFKEYARLSNGKIKTEIIDPIEQIGYAAQFGNIINGDESKIVVRCGNERRDVDFTRTPLTEEHLMNAIVRVTRAERHVYFLTGHGEYAIESNKDTGFSALAKLLSANNIVSKSLMLGTAEKIPEDCDVLVIAGPRNDLTEREEALVEEYLEKGGDALFLVEHVVVTTKGKPLTAEEQEKNPSLNNILNQWGVNIEKDIVVDLGSHAGNDVGSPATRNYMPHQAIIQGLDYTFYVRPRSITVLDDRRPSVRLAPFVLTASEKGSWAETNRMLKIHFDEGIDRPGPVPLSYVIGEEKADGDLSDTRIIVFTDADFLTNIFIKEYSNAQMGINIINWLSDLDYQAFLDKESVDVERLDLISRQKRKILVILFLMPLFIAVSGIVVWMRN